MCEDNKLSTKRSFNAFMINLWKMFDVCLHKITLAIYTYILDNKDNGILNKNHD